ncbi:aminotransferase class IV [Psychrobacter sp. N25K4-3-2]|uniref:aminotransferase class IV n=1 Tax=Psychrobacter sp. N25K4-3-2 TaxID=2785026 RepID=UPI00188AAEF5|nr:aminotransferase class IV [Psychrobacter sp. N25K4-3-2]MBF4490066.1 aminotransferase class IV [Psychrobacter sp. N25K4-3-2]
MPPSNSWIRLQPLSEASDNAAATALTMSLDNRGLAYGDGFFTTMGVIDGLILWSDYHQQRLDSHANALQLDIDSQALLATLQIQAKQLQQGMLKLIVTRAAQDVRGYGYAPSTSGSACEIWLKSSAMPIATAEQMPLPNGCLVPLQPVASATCLSSQLACLPPPLAGLKSLNRLDNVLASAELQRVKAQTLKSNPFLLANHLPASAEPNIGEGLLRDMSGHWVEGTMSNVFYQLSESPFAKSSNPPHPKNNNYLSTGQWYTPSMAQSGVAGVMRQVLIDGLSTTEQPVIIRSLSDEDLPHLSQLFFCNALRGIMPMSSLTLLSGEVVAF